MKQNVGGIDRILRILVGLGILGAGWYFQNWWGVIGVVPLVTGLIGWCPPYMLLGLNTCSTKATEATD